MAAAGALGVLALGAVLWSDGLDHLLGVYASSPTYTHGFLVPAVCLLLIADGWRRGDRIAVWPPALVGIGAASAGYTLGGALDIKFAQHAGIALLIPSVLALAGGRAFLIRHRFALGFFIFMVPVGEGLVPALQTLTAHGIMAALPLAGIAGARDGLLIMTEAGDFIVAEACAGLRFLVAMAVSGVLFAHLLMRAPARQAGFVALCVAVPILANVVRASLTVIVASHTDMTVAAGFDHLVYGWVFFAGIFALLLAIGIAMSQRPSPVRPTPPAPVTDRSALWPFAVAAGMIGLGGIV